MIKWWGKKNDKKMIKYKKNMIKHWKKMPNLIVKKSSGEKIMATWNMKNTGLCRGGHNYLNIKNIEKCIDQSCDKMGWIDDKNK